MLVSALLILPAASALQMSLNFRKTLIFAALLAIAGVIIGLFSSLAFNLPSGASIVAASLLLFVISYILKK
jgi:zinc transport system permease protein